ncbi:MAG: DNA-3-methyladenine glycosylase [Pyrinomonadaceae bacterium]
MTTRRTREADDFGDGLCYDPTIAVKHLAKADRVLAKLMKRAGPFALQTRHLHNPFEALARNIVFQQLHGTAAEAIHGRLVGLFGGGRLRPQGVIDASEEALRGVGLSGAKTAALKDLAAKTLDGTVPTLARLKRMDDEEIVARLTQVRGIGRWTVEMLLMFRLGRPDVLPVGDYAVRKGFMVAYGLNDMPKPKALELHAETWRPYRSVASWYMWRALEHPGQG